MAEIPDFRVQQQVPIAGLAELLASRPVKEAQIKALDEERRQSRFNTLLNAVKTGSDLATAGLARSQAKQEMEARRGLADILGRFGQNVSRGTIAEGPRLESGEAPMVFQRTTFGQTPEFESELLKRASMVAPEQFGTEIAQSMFPNVARQGTPPRSLEGVFVDQFNRGLLDEKTLLEKVSNANPEVVITEDPGTKLKYSYDRRTGQSTPLFKTSDSYNPVEKEAINLAGTEYNASQDVKELSSALTAADRARRLLDENPKGAPGFIKTMLAKMVENNRLSDQDIQRIAGSPSAVDRAIRAKSTIIDGNLSDVDKADFKAIVEIMERAAAEELDGILNDVTDSVNSDIPKASRGALKRRIGRGDVQKIERVLSGKRKKVSYGTSVSMGDGFSYTVKQ